MNHRTALPAASLVLIALAVATLACEGRDEPAPAETAAPSEAAEVSAPAAVVVDYKAEAKQVFDMRCTTCHGALGAGDGPKSDSLKPPPRNYQDREWQDSVSDERIANAVLYGGESVGLSAEMPGNPDLVEQQELLAALVSHIRTFRR